MPDPVRALSVKPVDDYKMQIYVSSNMGGNLGLANLVDLCEFFRSKRPVHCRGVGAHLLWRRRACDHRRNLRTRRQPRHGQFEQRVSSRCRERFQRFGDPDVLLGCESRSPLERQSASLGGAFAELVLAGQQPAREREVREEAEPARTPAARSSRARGRSRLYSFCTLDEPCRTGFAARGSASSICSAEKLLQPISRTLPACTRSSSAPSVSSTGTAGSGWCSWYRSMRSVPSRRRLSSTARRMYVRPRAPLRLVVDRPCRTSSRRSPRRAGARARGRGTPRSRCRRRCRRCRRS